MVIEPTPICYGGTVPFPVVVMSVPHIVSGSPVVTYLSRALGPCGDAQAVAGLALWKASRLYFRPKPLRCHRPETFVLV